MIIKILGSGCKNCKKLQSNADEAIKELHITATTEKVIDIKEIMNYGVMSTPALVINEKVKSFGRVLSKDQLKKIIEEEI